jgi:cell division protease FtsH
MSNEQNNKQPDRPPRSPLQGRPGGITLFFFLVMAIMFATYFLRGNNTSQVRDISYSEFINFLESDQIDSVSINDNSIIDIIPKRQSQQEPARLRTRIPYPDSELIPALKDRKIKISGSVSKPSFWRIVIDILPWLIGFGFIFLCSGICREVETRRSSLGKAGQSVTTTKEKKSVLPMSPGRKTQNLNLRKLSPF